VRSQVQPLQGFYPKATPKNGCNMGVLVAICNKCFEVGFVVSHGIYIGCNRLLRLNFDVLRYFDFRNEHKKQMLRTIWLQYEILQPIALLH
jgi:hypothetical protein